jgi:hypothetical protein
MSTGEAERLERVENLLENALQEADHVAVDLQRGRAELAQCLVKQQRSVRRRWVMAVAASVLAVLVVTTSIVLAGWSSDKGSLPATPSPELTFSPSGLPVGQLLATVDRTEAQATSIVRILVRSDGTGIFNPGTVGDSVGNATADMPVEIIGEGPGRAVLRSEDWCSSTVVLTLDFTVRGRILVIEDASTDNCYVSQGLVSDMTGTTMRILPLP